MLYRVTTTAPAPVAAAPAVAAAGISAAAGVESQVATVLTLLDKQMKGEGVISKSEFRQALLAVREQLKAETYPDGGAPAAVAAPQQGTSCTLQCSATLVLCT
jgi:hypothetical protein